MAGAGSLLVACSNCKHASGMDDRFCKICGQLSGPAETSRPSPPPMPGPPINSKQSFPGGHHIAAAKGLGQIFGVHPTIVFFTLLIDWMLFAPEVTSAFTILPLSIGFGIAVTIVTYLGQVHWYRDDKMSAFIKAIIMGVLTAIPTAIPSFIYAPAGLIGLAHWWRHRKDRELHA